MGTRHGYFEVGTKQTPIWYTLAPFSCRYLTDNDWLGQQGDPEIMPLSALRMILHGGTQNATATADYRLFCATHELLLAHSVTFLEYEGQSCLEKRDEGCLQHCR